MYFSILILLPPPPPSPTELNISRRGTVVCVFCFVTLGVYIDTEKIRFYLTYLLKKTI